MKKVNDADKLNGKMGRLNGKTVKTYPFRKGESNVTKKGLEKIHKETD